MTSITDLGDNTPDIIEVDTEGQVEVIETEFTYQYLRGASLEYDWDGTSLGIKTSEEDAFQYTELKGEKGETGDPGALSKDKIWVGNSDNVAEEQPLPDTSVEKIEGINEYVRRYVALYSQAIQENDNRDWVYWAKIMGKPETYPPDPHGHPISELGEIDYYHNVVNKPLLTPLNHNHNDAIKRMSARRAYMYGG